ncbi:MAG: glycosyltransferase family 2 protein [Methylococcaceae bacterium]|nr:glycosyltransferase family 2 protein [Methylococcaceae bacterium]
MKISAFTFIKNGEILGYPFIESINSILSIVDEFVIAVGKSEDNTLQRIKAIPSDKIRIIETTWNDNMHDRGYVYGQQKMIAQFNCTGDWAFYLEGDEVVHEDDLPKIKETMQAYLHDDNVEALVFDYYHFYGNANTYLDSLSWYKTEARIIKNSIRSYAPDGLFWLVLDKNKVGRYPKAAHTHAKIYHYGWVRNEQQMDLKAKKVQTYWNKDNEVKSTNRVNYREIDSTILKLFKGVHPKAIKDWLPAEQGLFVANPAYQLTKREKKHRLLTRIEKIFGFNFTKSHYRLIK